MNSKKWLYASMVLSFLALVCFVATQNYYAAVWAGIALISQDTQRIQIDTINLLHEIKRTAGKS